MTASPARPGVDGPLGPTLERALSHAVRTPLHSLMGFLELLSMSGLDDDQRRLHQRLADSADELLLGSDRVLWLLRLLGGHYRPRPARVHLAAFASEVAAASGGTVSVVVAPDAPPHVDADLAALHQLVTELVSNGLAHGASPIVLAVTPGERGSGTVRIIVSDGGAGTSAASRRALAAVVGGAEPATGLGLILVRKIAELLGGTVAVLPTHVGAQIELTLPLASGTAPTGTAPVAVPGSAGRQGDGTNRPLRVLLVEDNATNRLLTERQLARLGHSLISVATGVAGVAAALEPDVDVVLMDRHLPDIDGCEATRQIRAALPAGRAHLPIIAVTADATVEARDACAAAGMDEILTKPVDLEGLEGALARATASVDRSRDDGPSSGSAGPPDTPAGRAPAAYHSVMRRVDGDHFAAAELIATYLGELPGRRLRIQASLRRGEPRAVLAAADSLRTSSETVGAQAVVGACAALGAAAAEGDLPTARSFLPSLMLRCEQFAAELADYTDARPLSSEGAR